MEALKVPVEQRIQLDIEQRGAKYRVGPVRFGVHSFAKFVEIDGLQCLLSSVCRGRRSSAAAMTADLPAFEPCYRDLRRP
ncbi:hypothetical protein [Sorangium cellulosum]|uniref:hypothetical protein n=1 Tax=Sorangium cellulosum TaxID=56 RepID=UPI0012FF6720|nr:hypothetical protein [Sorangium cellulosum]